MAEKLVFEALKEKFVIVEPGVTGDAYALLNPLTNDWLVQGQSDGGAYYCDTKGNASAMCQTINHYNKTDEQKTFPNKAKLLQLESP